jgi:hypothetical protein
LISAAAGCAPSGGQSSDAASPATDRQRFAELVGLRSTPHAGLQAELALLESERMTPLLMDADLAVARPPAESAKQSRHSFSDRPLTGIEAVRDAYPALSRSLVRGQLDKVYRGGPPRLSPVELERARELLLRYADNRRRFQAALAGDWPGCGVSVADGPTADCEFLEPLGLGCRMEALAVGDALADNRPDDALPFVATIFRAAQIVGDQWNVTLRVAAANLRSEALRVLSAVAEHPHATRETHERLLAMIDGQLETWPPDARAWTADRAGGLVVYELVRDGYYLSLLPHGEVKRLEEQGLLHSTGKAASRNIDADEFFYLTSMRQMIEACGRPYFERVAVLQAIRQDLEAREATAEYPLVAGQLLLADFEAAHRRQAEDLSRIIAWRVALAAAIGDESSAPPANPYTGQPLVVDVSPAEIRVSGVLAPRDEPIVVPRREPHRQARADADRL